ncbi:cation-efflux pump [Paenibacillus sp. VTT E-133280]|jgi:cation diffusion facilitator family transporter|uniref:cation diffusion facilitator family transporter n=1 Tax=Paenibacillus TaxID=44249 RepID=UPI000B9FC2DF|nr:MULTISPECIES: cation diffusion facilitator family transporter [unclassified Paenibacillus]MDH6374356.1 cation diffusion facilitator family transporter [Paenibacillus sp. PastF-3]OZQ60853.1 cation-efflux pump [Paenibacillus sp. VTT E-133280]OZQ81157.1 cation-efflux pump [Paenibacillus sp. VTT E-133291]
MNKERSPQSKTVAWTGIISDVTLAVAKGSFGYISGSKALMGDALYSGADAAAKLADILPWRSEQSRKSKQRIEERRGNKEPLLAILFSVLILMGGLQIAFSAIRDLTEGQSSTRGELALVTVLLSIVLKEAVFQYQYRYFKKIGDGSHAAYANSHRFSLYTSITVLVGISLSMGGTYWHPLLYMDPIAALLTGCLILRKGYLLIVNTVSVKNAQELPSEEAANFIETVQRVHGVIRVEHLKALEQGNYVNLQVKISVNPRITVMEAQDISECARKLLQHRFVHVGEVHMDVVPYDPGYPYKSNYELADNDIPTLLQ